MSDDVNNPSHYQGKVEAIDCIESAMSAEAFKGYLQGNILKYTIRFQRKGGIKDLQKAQWYNNRLIKVLENEK